MTSAREHELVRIRNGRGLGIALLLGALSPACGGADSGNELAQNDTDLRAGTAIDGDAVSAGSFDGVTTAERAPKPGGIAIDPTTTATPLKPRSDWGVTVPTTGVIGPAYAPEVSLPASFAVGHRTSNTVSMGWQEVGSPTNPQTRVYRQKYDLHGNPVGPSTLIKTFDYLPKGPASFVDSTANTIDGTGPDPDRLTCYQLVAASGDCSGYSQGGPVCVTTPPACTYTQAVVPHKVGRLQLRIKVSSASTAAAPGDRIQVRLQSPYYPYAPTPFPRGNSTWLDSTQRDFVSSSNITYDLKLSRISDLSDINQITIATPDDDWLCINEVELLADNTPVFFKSFGADGVGCQGVYKSDTLDIGEQLTIPFHELRQSPLWQNFNPPNLVPPQFSFSASFVGYRPNEMIQMLDSIWGDTLTNPSNGYGDDAGFIDTHWTTAFRVNSRRLHVQHHVIAKDFDSNGSIAASPSYDLVIHDGPACAPKNWCVKVENIDPNTSSSGWWAIIPLVGSGIQAYMNNEAGGELQTAIAAMGGNSLNDPPPFMAYCFPGAFPADPKNSIFFNQGFGPGSLTLCAQ
jgi:hypothetical protein